MIDLSPFTHLSFDCYGTLIDWERGLLATLRPVLSGHGVVIDDAEILRLYARSEAAEEAGAYRAYREILCGVMRRMGEELGFVATAADRHALSHSVEDWPPFADTVAALHRLKTRFKLVIISNIDDEIFAQTARRLVVPFDAVITAQQVRQYKPSQENFRFALKRLGVPREQILHVAQSLYHDHAPAQALGWTTAWVNRPSCCPGTGVAPASDALPDLEVPDMESLARVAEV